MSKELYSDPRWHMPGAPKVVGYEPLTKEEQEKADKELDKFIKKVQVMRKTNKK